MTSRIPALSGTQVVSALAKAGFRHVSQKGSHIKLTNGQRIAIVPLHTTIARGTLASILRQAGLTTKQFLDFLD